MLFECGSSQTGTSKLTCMRCDSILFKQLFRLFNNCISRGKQYPPTFILRIHHSICRRRVQNLDTKRAVSNEQCKEMKTVVKSGKQNILQSTTQVRSFLLQRTQATVVLTPMPNTIDCLSGVPLCPPPPPSSSPFPFHLPANHVTVNGLFGGLAVEPCRNTEC